MREKIKTNIYKSSGKQKDPVSQLPKTTDHPDVNFPFQQIMHLQRCIGNQAVMRLLKSGAVQAKLKIGKPNDKYEQEADRVAEQVMRKPDPGIQRKPT